MEVPSASAIQHFLIVDGVVYAITDPRLLWLLLMVLLVMVSAGVYHLDEVDFCLVVGIACHGTNLSAVSFARIVDW